VVTQSTHLIHQELLLQQYQKQLVELLLLQVHIGYIHLLHQEHLLLLQTLLLNTSLLQAVLVEHQEEAVVLGVIVHQYLVNQAVEVLPQKHLYLY
jgi:hypothetical protein